MRFAIIGPAYPLRGGIAHHVYWLYRELTARAHDVLVVSYRRLYPRFLFPGRTTLDKSNLKLEVPALPLLDPILPSTWLKAFKTVRAFNPDLVVVQWWNPFLGPLTGILLRLLKAAGHKCVAECHNALPHERSALDLVLTDFALMPADSLITHSLKDKRVLRNLLGLRPVQVAPLPQLAELSSPWIGDRNGRRILFFGIVRKYKGLEVLIEAVAKVSPELGCDLTVVGEFYEPEEPYRQLIRKLGIESRVRVTNKYMPNEEVAALFAAADVLVLPYLSASQSAVAQVAMANGLPIIASRIGGLDEVVSHNVNGLLVTPGSVEKLAAALRRYFNSGLGPLFRQRIRNSSKTTFSVADALEAIARGLIFNRADGISCESP